MLWFVLSSVQEIIPIMLWQSVFHMPDVILLGSFIADMAHACLKRSHLNQAWWFKFRITVLGCGGRRLMGGMGCINPLSLKVSPWCFPREFKVDL